MSNKIIILQGDSTYSSFRLKKLNDKICNYNNQVIGVTNIYLLNVDSNEKIEIGLLEKLLNAKKVIVKSDENKIYIAPRTGTISPWSSKATDILHNCGFHTVKRIELANCLEFSSIINIDGNMGRLLYDRMTEFPYQQIH